MRRTTDALIAAAVRSVHVDRLQKDKSGKDRSLCLRSSATANCSPMAANERLNRLQTMARLLRWSLTIAVTGALVVYAFWDVNIWQLLALLERGAYWVTLPFIVCLALFLWLTAARWVLILRPIGRFTVADVTPAMMMGFAGNNILPARLGELLRTVMFALRYRLSKSSVLATVVLERLLDVFAVLLLSSVALLTMRPVPDSLRLGIEIASTVTVAALLSFAILLRWPYWVERVWVRLARPLPTGLRERGRQLIHKLAIGLSALKSASLVLGLIAYSVVKWLFAGAMVWLSIYSYGPRVGPSASLVVVGVMAIAMALPSVPGFFGVVQAAFVVALTPFGISHEIALAASVFYQLVQYFPVTLTGLVFFLASGYRSQQIREEMNYGT